MEYSNFIVIAFVYVQVDHNRVTQLLTPDKLNSFKLFKAPDWLVYITFYE